VKYGTYTKFELLRTVRNRRFFFLALVFPLGMYYLIAAPQRHTTNLAGTGISAPLYYMVGMGAFATMSAVISAGVRIAAERQVGWNRQLRLTPLTTRGYFRAKVMTAYLTAGVALLLLYVAGMTLGVRLAAHDWVTMTEYILIGLIPFVALGILLGHLLTTDSISPAVGGATALFAIMGGAWFPVGTGTFGEIAKLLPSYWLVQASHVVLGGGGWGMRGWITVGAWAVVLAALAGQAYQRDTRRV
jgi:ABC-2 type transport system permease protein